MSHSSKSRPIRSIDCAMHRLRNGEVDPEDLEFILKRIASLEQIIQAQREYIKTLKRERYFGKDDKVEGVLSHPFLKFQHDDGE